VTQPLQPLLHDQEVVLAAPSQAWFSPDGSMGSAMIHGAYVSDVRVIRTLDYVVGDAPAEHIATARLGAARSRITHLLRALDGPGADPGVRSRIERTATQAGLQDTYVISSRLEQPIDTTVELAITPDLSSMDAVKAGFGADGASGLTIGDGTATWADGDVSVHFEAPGATLTLAGPAITVRWPVTVPARGEAAIRWSVSAVDARAVVHGAEGTPEWHGARVTATDRRFERWIAASLDDLDALRLTTTHAPGEEFLAAGAPWFFTMFGRDSIWAARMLLPFGTRLAASTLRALAALQGTERVADTAEQPGKIMHELRRAALDLPGEGITLPPLYYGTVDATPLWICLLHDAWRWGMPEHEVEALLPHLQAALEWMRDFGDADGDGLLEYVDETGHGLANQGWKDSGDSVQWRDGRLATGPIALCEVQAYAYEAATHGADLLEHFRVGEPDSWRAWAASLRSKFSAFWIEDANGSYPAIALDADKKPVDTVTSNLGHLLGTGLLTDTQAEAVAARLVDPTLNSGYGLRTMSTDSAGYWPLSYHGGSVWTHDTAIAIAGLARDGFTAEAAQLADGLLAAAVAFDYRMPELHSGDAASAFSRPVPYPAACRPQAWSAAAAIAVLASLEGLTP